MSSWITMSFACLLFFWIKGRFDIIWWSLYGQLWV